MKKMLVCISTLGAGGAEKSLVNFVNEYKNKYNISNFKYITDDYNKNL